MTLEADVVVVGGGPVGTGLAIDLAQRGHSVCIVERQRSIQRIPKGQNLTQRTGEHFARWGISAQIRAASPIPPGYGNAGMVAYGTLLSGYHYDWFKRASVAPYYSAENERLPQYETEAILRRRASEFASISAFYGWTFKHHDITADDVTVHARQTDSDAVQSIRARYLVGCDGAGSAVRQALNLTQSLHAHDRRMVLLVFRSRSLDNILQRFAGKSIYNVLNPAMQGYWQFLGRVDLDGRFFFHAPVPDDTTSDNFNFQHLLEQVVGAPFTAEFEHIGFWDLRFALANSYGSGQAYIAGDAAHSHPPYGGFGINTGFEDICNLSWKLSAVLHGWAPAKLLSSYSTERHPVFESTRDDFIARMISNDAQFTRRYDPRRNRSEFETAWARRASEGNAEVEPFLPHYAGSPLVCGVAGAKSGAVGQHAHRALAGFHLSPQILENGRSSHTMIGSHFTLIAFQQDGQLLESFSRAARALAIPLTVISSAAIEACRQWQADIILLRPDGFVAFAGNKLQHSPGQLLRIACGYNL